MDTTGIVVAALVGAGVGIAAATLVHRRRVARREHRARQAERRAAEAERLAETGAMTSGLAHEIRNPLSTLVLNAQLLREDVLDSAMPEEERERIVRRIDSLARESARLKDILEDFLRFAGRMKLDPQPCDLRPIVEELVDFFGPHCTQSGVVLRTEPSGAPVRARADSALLKQAILNLMINAVQAMQATPAGRRELLVRLATDPDGVRIHVTDTGPGIPPEQREAIFHPYVTGKAGGTGLGLAVARRIVEEHGGTLEVHSEVGTGSDFVVRLPPEG